MTIKYHIVSPWCKHFACCLQWTRWLSLKKEKRGKWDFSDPNEEVNDEYETGASKNRDDGPLDNLYEYTGKPIPVNQARIFPPKDIPEKYAKLDAMDKFRMPPATPPAEPKIRKVVPKDNAKLDPMDKLRSHPKKKKSKKDAASRDGGNEEEADVSLGCDDLIDTSAVKKKKMK